MTKIFLLSYLSIFSFGAYGQSSKVDSLKKILEIQKEDTNKVKTLNNLSEDVVDANLEMKYAEMAKNLSRKLNYLKGEANALSNQGHAQLIMKNYFEAYTYFDSSIQTFKLLNDKSGEAGALWNFAFVFVSKDKEKALDYGMQALKISEEIRDTSLTNACLQLVGSLKGNSGIPELKRILYLNSIFRKDWGGRSLEVCRMIGRIYLDLGNLDSALYYYREAEKECKKASDTIFILRDLGDVYLKMKNYKNAINYYTQLYDRAKVKDRALTKIPLVGLGKVYLENKNYQIALKYYKAAEKIGPNYLDDAIYKALILINEKKGNFKEVYRYQKKLESHLDSLHTNELKQKLAPLQLNFSIRKKQDSVLLVKNKALN